jgi:uracil-DNA glycosylase family 4
VDDTTKRKLALIQVRDSVRVCTSCELHKTAKAPVPISGPLYARYVVVGQSPGQIEDYKGEAFTGPAGRFLRQLLKAHGLTPDQAAYMNVVSCIPKGNKEDRHAVSPVHLKACRHNVEIQLMAACSEYVLVCGGVALKTFMPNAELKWAKGGFYRIHGFNMMPIFHPSYALKERSARPDIEHCLDVFAKVLEGVLPAEWVRNNWCIYCGSELYSETPACVKHQKLWRADSLWDKPRQEKLI